MPKATTGLDLARKLCAEHPDAPSRQLGRMLYKENVERFPNLDAACQSIRKARGNQGEKNRARCKKTDERRPNAPLGWVPSCPPSHAEPWLPFEINGPATIGVLSDVHIPYHDSKALETAVGYLKKRYKIDTFLLNGDYMDFHTISRWEKEPKSRSLADECRIGVECLSWFRGQFRKANFIYKQGNHCERLDKYIWNKAPELWGLNNVQLRSVLEFERFGITEVSEQRPIMAGKLPIFHGHELPRGISSPVNPARGAYTRTAHTMLMGHLHRPSTHTEPDMFKNDTTCWSTGCLCSMSPQFARLNKWSHGFCYVEVEANGAFNVHNFQITKDGTVRPA